MKIRNSVLISIAALVFLIGLTDVAGQQGDEQSFNDLREIFNKAFFEELGALRDQNKLSGSDDLILEILWEKNEGKWKPSSFSVAAQIIKTIPHCSVERRLRYHGIWRTTFRDISQEPNVARDAARTSFDFLRAMAQWEWASPHPLLDLSFVSFLSRFEHFFRFYEIHLSLGVPDEPKLRLVFDYLPFPGEEIVDIKGMLIVPFPFEQLIGRALLLQAAQNDAGKKFAKQAFFILMGLRDFENFRRSVPDHPSSLLPRTTFSPVF